MADAKREEKQSEFERVVGCVRGLPDGMTVDEMAAACGTDNDMIVAAVAELAELASKRTEPKP